MEIKFAEYTSIELSSKSKLIQNFSQEIGDYFDKKSYGGDLMALFVGIVCVSPNFMAFFKPRKPKYFKGKKNIESEGFSYSVENYLEFDVKIEFDLLLNATEIEVNKILARELLNSINLIYGLKKKIIDFNIDLFIKDIEKYFKSKEFI